MKKKNSLQPLKYFCTTLLTCVFLIQCAAEKKDPFFKISLAQWSINKMIKSKKVSPYNFAKMATEWGFDGIEYVNQLYTDVTEAEDKEAALDAFVKKSKVESDKYGIRNVLIMIDHEGDLSATDSVARAEAVANHMGWVKAAAALGCHSVRVNLKGAEDANEWIEASIAGLSELARQAAEYKINVIVENHGGHSSNPELLMQVINTINLPNCGTLPDFGNFCLDGGWGGINSGCPNVYPIYKGVEEMLPRAFALSAKAYGFDADGNEANIDFVKMLQLAKNAGYTGYVGVEYEGEELSEPDGIQVTKELLIRAAQGIE